MRFRITYLLLLVLLASSAPGQNQHDPAQHDSAESHKNAEAQRDVNILPEPEKEHWTVPGDFKTGLQPRPPVQVQRDEQPDFVRELIRVQWRPNDPIDLWIIRPKLPGKVPVILYIYNYTDSSDRFHDNGWCRRVTADGFAAVGFVSALSDYRFKYRPLRQWFVSELAESLGSSVHDVQLILNHLTDRGDVDMNRVGMFGMGSGATIAILAAGADSRIKAVDALDPWGDWPDWFKESPVVSEPERAKYLTREFLKSVAALDPVTYLPSLKIKSFRLQQTVSEPVTPGSAKNRISSAVPLRTEIAKYQNAKDLAKAWQAAGLSGWIKQQLRSETPNKAVAASSLLKGLTVDAGRF